MSMNEAIWHVDKRAASALPFLYFVLHCLYVGILHGGVEARKKVLSDSVGDNPGYRYQHWTVCHRSSLCKQEQGILQATR